jgi:hypothetical protein
MLVQRVVRGCPLLELVIGPLLDFGRRFLDGHWVDSLSISGGGYGRMIAN